ncbi:luciferase [Halobacteriales archaeon QS_4_70_19]|nr:MAG: luciferase [Halobacteriales archaeon QS_4_70_19]
MLTENEDTAETEPAPTTRADIDAVALKPTEHDLGAALDLPVDTVAVDYEGRDAVPDEGTLARLAERFDCYVTTPVRADGFDPLGDDSLLDHVPDAARRVVVAGHPAYLTEEERERAVAPRLRAARETAPDAWVGTESVERVALAAGGVQYELLGRGTEHDVQALRAAGFDGGIALYAPVVLSTDEDGILDAVGAYAARRAPVRHALPDNAAVDATATGRAREVLSQAVRDYALVGDAPTVADRVADLRAAGVDTVVGYPARGIDELQ